MSKVYIYRFGSHRDHVAEDRLQWKGRRCTVLARGGMNSVLVQFENGERLCTSRNAIRRAE